MHWVCPYDTRCQSHILCLRAYIFIFPLTSIYGNHLRRCLLASSLGNISEHGTELEQHAHLGGNWTHSMLNGGITGAAVLDPPLGLTSKVPEQRGLLEGLEPWHST